MFTAIDYNSYENKVIEERVRDNYQEIKGVFETVLMRRIKDPYSPVGLGEIIVIDGKVWYRVYLKSLKRNGFLLGTAFWFPVSKDYNAERLKILECALEDLERMIISRPGFRMNKEKFRDYGEG